GRAFAGARKWSRSLGVAVVVGLRWFEPLEVTGDGGWKRSGPLCVAVVGPPKWSRATRGGRRRSSAVVRMTFLPRRRRAELVSNARVGRRRPPEVARTTRGGRRRSSAVVRMTFLPRRRRAELVSNARVGRRRPPEVARTTRGGRRRSSA